MLQEQINAAGQKYIAGLAATAKELWRKACEYDGIPPDAVFVCFSKENPYADFYNRVMGQLQEARQQYAAGGYVGLSIRRKREWA